MSEVLKDGLINSVDICSVETAIELEKSGFQAKKHTGYWCKAVDKDFLWLLEKQEYYLGSYYGSNKLTVIKDYEDEQESSHDILEIYKAYSVTDFFTWIFFNSPVLTDEWIRLMQDFSKGLSNNSMKCVEVAFLGVVKSNLKLLDKK